MIAGDQLVTAELGSKTRQRERTLWEEGTLMGILSPRRMTAVIDALNIIRPHLSEMRNRSPPRPRGRPPLPDTELIANIRLLFAGLPTYGYRRAHALLRPGTQPIQIASTTS